MFSIHENRFASLKGLHLGFSALCDWFLNFPWKFLSPILAFTLFSVKGKAVFESEGTLFLVGTFLEKRVDYSHGFSSVFFLRPPELTKIVLPKVLQNFNFHLLAQGTEPKSFPHSIQCRTRPKGPPFSFFRHCETFFRKKNFPQRAPFKFFRRCETFFKNFLVL